MFDFHEKRKIRSLVYSKPVIGLLLIAAGFLSLSAYNRYEIAVETREKRDMRQAELTKLIERAESLEAKVQYLENERGVEEELRSRFDVAKEGEDVIVLVEDTRQPSGADATLVETSTEPRQTLFEWLKFW